MAGGGVEIKKTEKGKVPYMQVKCLPCSQRDYLLTLPNYLFLYFKGNQ